MKIQQVKISGIHLGFRNINIRISDEPSKNQQSKCAP